MKRTILLIFTTLLLTNTIAQTLVANRDQIEKAKKDLEPAISLFSSSIVKKDLDTSISTLVKSADNDFKKYIIGGFLFSIDSIKSFQLHQEAYLNNKSDKNFTLEYAIELHRKGKYKEASLLYEKYIEAERDDFRIYVWLADCYINTGEINKSIESWTKANHPKNHTGIDFAIHIIYANTGQLKQRNEIRRLISAGDLSKFSELIFLDQNWEVDWWNKKAQEYFLKEDLEAAKQKLGETSSDYKLLKAYAEIKKLEANENNPSEIKAILTANNLILNDKPLPAFGPITSDLLRICFINQLLSETEFYNKRGNELLEFSLKTKDKELLNIYAYLQATVDGYVKPEIDKLGWKDFKDERFAISYFLGKADKNRFDDPELQQAILDFPNSSKLYWIKLNCAKIENKKLKPIIIEVIKREFKTLGSDQSKYSYGLKNYFSLLETGE